MRIHGIRINNFLSYGEHHNVIEFDKGASRFLQTHNTITKLEREGLYSDAKKYLEVWQKDQSTHIISIVGKIDGNPRESNGAGKSSGFEAIAYALYNKTIRESVNKDKDEDRNKGKSTNSIIREITPGNYASESFVELLFSVDNGLWLLRRGRKLTGTASSAILRVDCLTEHDEDQQGSRAGHRKADAEDTLSKLVKWDFETFVNSVMFGQSDAGQFLIGTDKVRKNIIINILNLGVVTDYLSECRKRKSATQQTIDSLQAQLQLLAGKPTSSEPIRASIASIRSQIDTLKADLETLDGKIQELRRSEDMSKYQNALTEANLKLELWNQKKKDFAGQKQIIDLQISQVGQKINQCNSDLEQQTKQKKTNQDGLEQIGQQIKLFDENVVNSELGIIQQAKEAKPIRTQNMLDLQKIASTIQFDIGGLKGTYSLKKKELDLRLNLKKDGQVSCPTCGTMVDQDHIQGESDRLSNELALIQSQIDEKQKLATANELEKKAIQEKLTLIDQYLAKESDLNTSLEINRQRKEKLSSIQETIRLFEESIPNLQTQSVVLNSERQTLLDKLDQIKKSETSELQPYEQQYLIAKQSVDGLQSGVNLVQQAISKALEDQTLKKQDMDQKLLEIGRLETQAVDADNNGIQSKKIHDGLDEHHKKLNRLKILEQMYGVDGVQTAIVNKYLPLLNSYLNEYIDIVGGGKTHVSIVTDGKVDGKVDLVIKGQCASKSVMTSGGEKVKVHLAISIALGLLAFARSKEVPEFICLDEVIAPVDDLTKDHIFAMLKKLQEHFRTILVVSHDKSLRENIAHEIVVDKIRGVSRIEKQHFETQKKELEVV